MVFIVLSIMFAIIIGVWGVVNYGSSGKIAELALGIGSLVGAVGMSVYLYFFLRKFKHISYL